MDGMRDFWHMPVQVTPTGASEGAAAVMLTLHAENREVE